MSLTATTYDMDLTLIWDSAIMTEKKISEGYQRLRGFSLMQGLSFLLHSSLLLKSRGNILKKVYKVKDYTGISSPFEEPDDSDIVIDTEKMGIEEAVSKVLSYLHERDFLSF